MPAGFYAELIIRIQTDNAQAMAGLNQTAAAAQAASARVNGATKSMAMRMQRAGLAMQNIGRTMTNYVTLPVAAGFAYAAYSGIKFENTLLKIKNLTGLTQAETDRYSKAILDLSTNTGVSAQLLSESFYAIASSGFKGGEAMELLTNTAKASASGMGDMAVISDALTSAINSYGHGALSAQRATDILMKTVEVGKAEPEALAASLGRIMPVSAKLGVSFGELGGMIAGLTLGGLSSAEAVTALRGTMMALVAPAKMSIDELKKYGLSVGEVKRKIKDDGLLETLEMLNKATGGNELSLRKIIPNVRALNGVLSMLGANYQNTQRTIDAVTASQGKLNQAFGDTQQTQMFKLKQAWETFRTAFIRAGIDILPALTSLVQMIGGLAAAFNRLPDGTRKFIMQAALVLAAAGPLVSIFGSLVRSAGLLGGALKGMSGITVSIASIRKLGGALKLSGQGFQALRLSALGSSLALVGLGIAAAALIAYLIKINAETQKYNQMAEDNNLMNSGAWNRQQEALSRRPSDFGMKKYEQTQQMIWKLAIKTEGKGDADALLKQAELWKRYAQDFKVAGWGSLIMQIQRKGITGRELIYEFQQMRLTLMKELSITGKQADVILKGIFGKKYTIKMPEVRDMDAFLRNWEKKVSTIATFTKKNGEKAGLAMVSEFVRTANNGKMPVAVAKQVLHIAVKLDKLKDHGGKAGQQLVDMIANRTAGGSTKAGLQAEKLAKNMATHLGVGFKDTGKEVDKTKKTIAEKVAGAIRNAITKGSTEAERSVVIGNSLVTGMKGPITADILVGPVQTAVQRAIRAGMDAAEAKSPSRKMMKLGRWMMEGLAIGITQKEGEAIARASEVAQNVLSAFEAVLGVNASIGQMQQNGLFSVATGKAWAQKVAVRIKAMFNAMWSELKGLDLLDKEKGDKTIPGAGSKFSAIATMAGDIGSILTAFVDLTDEALTKSLSAMTSVRAHAREIGQNINAMAHDLMEAISGTLITQITSDNASRAVQMANDLAGVITTFAELTAEKIDQAILMLNQVAASRNSIAGMVKLIATSLRDAFAGTEIKQELADTASRAVQLTSDMASIISTFSEMTQEKLDAAISGIAMTANNLLRGSSLRFNLILLVWRLNDVFKDVTVEDAITEASTASAQLVGDITGIITSLSSMTENAVTSARAGMQRVIAYAQDGMGQDVLDLIAALKEPLDTISKDTTFTTVSPYASTVNDFVSNVAGIIGGLAGLYPVEVTTDENGTEKKTFRDIVDEAKTAMAKTKTSMQGFGTALLDFVNTFISALDIPGVKSLADLQPSLSALNEMVGAIKGIADSLADMGQEKVDAASGAGSALGRGFYNGLLGWYDDIMTLAQSIADGASTALSGGTPPAAPTPRAMAAGGIVTRPTLALIGEAGPEAVIPLSGRSSGGSRARSVTVHQYFNISVQALEPDERVVARLAAKLQPVTRRAANEMARKVPR